MTFHHELLDDPEWIRNARIEQLMSMKDIAAIVGCTISIVQRKFKQHGIVSSRTKDVHCATCSKPKQVTFSTYKKSKTGFFFCDQSCHAVWLSKNQVGENHQRWKGLSVPCAQCGTPIHTTPSKKKAQENHFCSRDCQGKWASANRVGEKSSNWRGGMAELFCEYCGQPTERYQCLAGKHNMFFCDFKCKGSWQSENLSGQNSPIYKKVEVPCSQCGTPILRHPCRLEEHENQFCSRSCFGKWISENKSGENSYQWNPDKSLLYYGPGWRRIAKEVRYRDGFKCQHCGITERKLGKALDVHHIIPLRTFNGDYDSANQKTNLISLCKSCHNMAEAGSIYIQPRLV